MKVYLENFLSELDFPLGAREALILAFRKISASKIATPRFFELVEEYKNNPDFDFKEATKEAGELSERAGVVHFTGKLLFYILMSQTLRERYRQRGIDDSVFKNSMLDLKYKVIECYEAYGIWGSFVAWWFSGFFKMNIFGLGRLQFELRTLGTDYEKDGIKLTPDSPVLSVHIPSAKEPFTYDKVWEAYKLAADFFRETLGDAPIVFYCNTWLFFEKHKEMLKPTSNIYRFMSDYDIFEYGLYDDYTQVWRLFGKYYTGNPDDMPADSSLRRSYIELMRRGEKTGWGTGVLVYKEK